MVEDVVVELPIVEDVVEDDGVVVEVVVEAGVSHVLPVVDEPDPTPLVVVDEELTRVELEEGTMTWLEGGGGSKASTTVISCDWGAEVQAASAAMVSVF